METNKGFDSGAVAAYKSQCDSSQYGFIPHPEEERTPEYAHVYFTGIYDGREVVYDTVLYTLRLQHESELYSMAEEMTKEKFPDYADADTDGAEEGEPSEEVAMYMAEIILGLEEEESVRVQEHAEVDPDAGFGVGLDVGLHVQEITDAGIAKFIRDFKTGNLKLDPTLYTFQFSDSREQ